MRLDIQQFILDLV